jgi:hypothetical protein
MSRRWLEAMMCILLYDVDQYMMLKNVCKVKDE